MKKIVIFIISFSMLFITILNIIDYKNLTNSNIKKEIIIPIFTPTDRPFGENLVSIPTRACLPLISIDIIENTSKTTEEICNNKNLEPYIAYGDLDNDYLSEVMLIDREGMIYLYWNNGTSYKQLQQQSIALSKFTKNTNKKGIFFFLDANNDNLNDIIISNNSSKKDQTLILNKGNREFDFNNPITIKTNDIIGIPTNVTTDDLNKDGLADFVFTLSDSIYPFRIFISTNEKNNYYQEITKDAIIEDEYQQSIYEYYTPLIYDFNQDSYQDIFITANYNGSELYLGQKNNTFKKSVENENFKMLNSLTGAYLTDLNYDGKLDILATKKTYNKINCYFQRECSSNEYGNVTLINNKNASFTTKFPIQTKENDKNLPNLSNTKSSMGFAPSDYNMDGYIDYFIGSGSKAIDRSSEDWDSNFEKPYLLLSDSKNIYQDYTGELYRNLLMLGATSIVASTDFNGDYRPDILILSEDQARPHLLLNTTKTKNSSAALVIRGSGLGGSPYNGEGSIITVKIKNKPTQKFKLPSKSSNFRSYSATSPIMIGLEKENEAIVTVEFTSGKIVTEKIRKNKINIISEAP